MHGLFSTTQQRAHADTRTGDEAAEGDDGRDDVEEELEPQDPVPEQVQLDFDRVLRVADRVLRLADLRVGPLQLHEVVLEHHLHLLVPVSTNAAPAVVPIPPLLVPLPLSPRRRHHRPKLLLRRRRRRLAGPPVLFAGLVLMLVLRVPLRVGGEVHHLHVLVREQHVVHGLEMACVICVGG